MRVRGLSIEEESVGECEHVKGTVQARTRETERERQNKQNIDERGKAGRGYSLGRLPLITKLRAVVFNVGQLLQGHGAITSVRLGKVIVH